MMARASDVNRKPGSMHWREQLDITWKVILAVVGILVMIDAGRSYFGERRTSPAEALEGFSLQLKQLTLRMEASDSLQAIRNNTVERAILQNSYSICVIAKRPQGDCADILLNAPIRRQ